MNPRLSVCAVTRRFRGSARAAVDGVSFTVGDCEIAALVGESGCGKTTMLRMIAGFEVPDEGRIVLSGRELSGPAASAYVPPEKRRIGMVFQDHTLFPHLSVERNIGFGLPRGGRNAAGRARVAAMVAMMGLEGLEGRYPHEISGGQEQRAALARSLAPEPRLLLMDEAFNNLDMRLKQRLLPEIRRAVKASGTPALLVTHDRYEAFELADRILLMRDGAVIQNGTPRELYESPADSYAAGFFGETNHFALGAEHFVVRPENITLRDATEAARFAGDDAAGAGAGVGGTAAGAGAAGSGAVFAAPPFAVCEGCLRAAGHIQDLRYRGDIHEVRVLLDEAGASPGDQIVVAHSRGRPIHGPGQAVQVEIDRGALVRVG